jgi:hypothetical protein
MTRTNGSLSIKNGDVLTSTAFHQNIPSTNIATINNFKQNQKGKTTRDLKMSGCGCASSGACGCGEACTCDGCPVRHSYSPLVLF